MGHERRFDRLIVTSGLAPTADVSGHGRHFAFGPSADVSLVFDCLVGERQHSRRYDDSERSRGFLIDHHSEFARLFDREVARFLPAQNSRDIESSVTKAVGHVDGVRHQETRVAKIGIWPNSGLP